MLTIPTRIAPSGIHGLGLFAVEPIPKGTVVWEMNPLVDIRLTQEQADSLPPLCREKATRHWGYLHKSGVYIFPADGAQFMNHADDPNVAELDNDVDGNIMIAVRDIALGEEFTCDYRTFDQITRAQGLPGN